MAIDVAKKYLTPMEVAVLKLGLSLRIYSARIEMFIQMASNRNVGELDCENVVDVGGRLTCSVDDLERLIERVRNFLLSRLFKINSN